MFIDVKVFVYLHLDTQYRVDVRNMTAETLNFGPEW